MKSTALTLGAGEEDAAATERARLRVVFFTEVTGNDGRVSQAENTIWFRIRYARGDAARRARRAVSRETHGARNARDGGARSRT
jgi:hypothetical protein